MIHRQPASNGDTNAGHTTRGSRRPGHYGVDRVTQQNLEVVRADAVAATEDILSDNDIRAQGSPDMMKIWQEQ